MSLRPRRRLPRRSLLVRILGLHAIGIAAAAFITLSAANGLLQYRTRTVERHVLSDQASGILGGIALGPDGAPRIDYALTPISQRERGIFLFAVMDRSGRVLLRSNDPAAVKLTRLRRLDRTRFLTLARQEPVLATIIRPFRLGDTPLWLAVGWNLSMPGVIFDNVLHDFFWYSIGVTLVVLVALLALDLVVMRGALGPLLRVTEAVRGSQRSGDEWRLTLDELPYEILPLAGAYNEALDKVEAAYQLQRAFAADAAHELRTPLAVLQARLETLPGDPIRRLLLGDVAVMTRIVAQLLEIASLERLVVDHAASADPATVCGAVIEALAPMAIAGGRELGLSVGDAPAVRLRVRDQELFQVVRNLVENAINHTRQGTRIDVQVASDGLVTVQDDGPGLPAELHQIIFERFWRRDRRDRSGAGLGLAIVRRIVTSHGGTVTLYSEEGQGCQFMVRLPPVPAASGGNPHRLHADQAAEAGRVVAP